MVLAIVRRIDTRRLHIQLLSILDYYMIGWPIAIAFLFRRRKKYDDHHDSTAAPTPRPPNL